MAHAITLAMNGPMTIATPRLRIAELTSGIGAVVLGLGGGALLASYLAPVAVLVLFAGVLLHSWGMFDKHRIENTAGAPPSWWVPALYWVCWAGLAALCVYVVARWL